MSEHGTAEQVAAARSEIGGLSTRVSELTAPAVESGDRRQGVASLRAEIDRLGERVEALRAARLRQLADRGATHQQEVRAERGRGEAAEVAKGEQVTEDAGGRWSPPESSSSAQSRVSDCGEVDFEKTSIAEARRSGDVLAALSRLTERAREVRTAREASLAVQQEQAGAEGARAEQLARWHADDHQAAEQAAATEREHGLELTGGEAA